MCRHISHLWRVTATGLAFLTFNLGGLFFAAPAIAICRMIPGSRDQKELRAQKLIHLSFRAYVGFIVALGILTHSRRNLAGLSTARPSLVIANHPTLLDVVFLIAAMPRVDCVIKTAVWNNVFLRGIVRGAGYIPNHESAQLIDACVERLRSGRHVLLFPEGTRSPVDGLNRFQRGAARIALKSGCDLIPVVLTCEPPTLRKGMKWHEIPPRRFHVGLEVESPLSPAPYLVDGKETPNAARSLTSAMQLYFEQRLGLART